MALDVFIQSITFSGGETVPPPERGVLLIVGPNNVGKSMALREIASLFSNPPHPNAPPPLVITHVSIEKHGDESEFEAWLDAHAKRRDPTPGNPQRIYTKPGVGRMDWNQLLQAWAAAPPMGAAAGLFHGFLGPGERLNLLGSASLWDPTTEDPSNPLQLLYDAPELEETFRVAAIEAFRQPVFVNRYAGPQIHLQIGEPPEPVPPPAPTELVRALRERPLVQEQGDGIRSFMGILLSLIAGDQHVILIDEPEAFLHPPQAQLLGKTLALSTPNGKQVVAATHSSDVVIGALDAPDAAVTIVRITREGDVNHAAVLPHEQLRDLWSHPMLRYSNVLDGLFHRGVVVCEADSDSLFYSAAVDHLLKSRGLPASELLFTFSGGKSGLYKAAAALRAVQVPVILVTDLDILKDPRDVERVLQSLGTDPAPFLELQRLIAADVNSSGPNPRKEFVQDRLTEILDRAPSGEPLQEETIGAIKKLLRSTSPWDALKEAGLVALAGDALLRARDFVARAAEIGLLVLEVGELESFERAIAGHGPEWVAAALENEVHLRDAPQRFAESILSASGLL